MTAPGMPIAAGREADEGRRRLPSLSVVIPVFNGENWIEPTLSRLDVALAAVPEWRNAELVVVDDGSTDGTKAILDGLEAATARMRVVRQVNRGRFLARHAGLLAATGDIVLLLDVRVFLEPSALQYLAGQLADHPDRHVWNGHCEIDVRENRYARFWSAVTFAAWRRYLANPRLVAYGEDDFDYYPKGTGCFVAPRSALLDAYDRFTSHYDELHRVNDDTSLLRGLAARYRIWLGPGFACTYHARTSLRQFLGHAHARGIHFVDGYLRPSSRYAWFIVAFLVATPIGFALLVLKPVEVVAALLALAVIAGVALVALGAPVRTSLVFSQLLIPFAVAYGTGIWRGSALAALTRFRRKHR